MIALTLAIRLPHINADLGHTVIDIDEARLASNVRDYFLTYAAGEVRDPTRNVPRALTIGLLSVMAIYLVVNVAYLVALPMSKQRPFEDR